VNELTQWGLAQTLTLFTEVSHSIVVISSRALPRFQKLTMCTRCLQNLNTFKRLLSSHVGGWRDMYKGWIY